MYDVVIRGGAIHDGTGGPAHNGDVAIKDGVIAAVGKFRSTEARQTIEADGAIVTPGFIDLHSHYDGQFLSFGTIKSTQASLMESRPRSPATAASALRRPTTNIKAS